MEARGGISVETGNEPFPGMAGKKRKVRAEGKEIVPPWKALRINREAEEDVRV